MNDTTVMHGEEWRAKVIAIAGGIAALMAEYGEALDILSCGTIGSEVERMRILRAQIAEEEKRLDMLLPSEDACGDQPGQLSLFKK